MSVTGEGPDRPPLKCGSPMTDIGAGILGALGVCAALNHRAQTGEGQMVDTSLLEAGVTFTYWQSALVLAGAPSPGRMGTAHPLDAPYQAYEAADGWLTLGTASEGPVARPAGRAWLARTGRGPAFCRHRPAHEPSLRARGSVQRALSHQAARRVAGRARPRPVSPLDRCSRSARCTTTRRSARERWSSRRRIRRSATSRRSAAPIKFSETPASVRKGAPLLGEDTRDILRGCGYDDAEIDRLAAQQVIVAA